MIMFFLFSKVKQDSPRKTHRVDEWQRSQKVRRNRKDQARRRARKAQTTGIWAQITTEKIRRKTIGKQ